MTSSTGGLLAAAVSITLVVIVLSMVFTFVRLARGPTLPDRVIALDLLGILMVAFAAVYAIAAREPAFLDVAIGFALVAFLSTVAFARYADRRHGAEHGSPMSGDDAGRAGGSAKGNQR